MNYPNFCVVDQINNHLSFVNIRIFIKAVASSPPWDVKQEGGAFLLTLFCEAL
jgi:hypothetical protein